jgi:secreted Zn-dependent insulinase-like peptidase
VSSPFFHWRDVDCVWFMSKAKEPNANSGLFLPRPNQFIPTSLHVDKKEISQVRTVPPVWLVLIVTVP